MKIRTLQSFETSGTTHGTAQCPTREHLALTIHISQFISIHDTNESSFDT